MRSEKPYASLRSFPNVAFEPVPVFVWTMALSRPFKEDGLALLSSRRSMVWCPWLCARRQCLKLLNTSDLPRSRRLCEGYFARESIDLLCLFAAQLNRSVQLSSAQDGIHAPAEAHNYIPVSQSSGAVWKSRWPSWALRSIIVRTVSVDVKQN